MGDTVNIGTGDEKTVVDAGFSWMGAIDIKLDKATGISNICGTVGDSGDKRDTYRFIAPESRTARITLRGAKARLYLILLDNNGRRSDFSMGSRETNDITFDTYLIKNKIYFLSVTPYTKGLGSEYLLEIDTVSEVENRPDPVVPEVIVPVVVQPIIPEINPAQTYRDIITQLEKCETALASIKTLVESAKKVSG